MTEAQKLIYDYWYKTQTTETLKPYLLMPNEQFATEVLEPFRDATKAYYDNLISGTQSELVQLTNTIDTLLISRQLLEIT